MAALSAETEFVVAVGQGAQRVHQLGTEQQAAGDYREEYGFGHDALQLSHRCAKLSQKNGGTAAVNPGK
jgi:hypothetical protein